MITDFLHTTISSALAHDCIFLIQSGGLPLAIASWKSHVPVVRVLLEESVKKIKVDKFAMVCWITSVILDRRSF